MQAPELLLMPSSLQNRKDSEEMERFILVQMPEPISPELPASKAGFEDIAQITKQRIRRAGEQIREESPMFVGDLGFRAFALAS